MKRVKMEMHDERERGGRWKENFGQTDVSVVEWGAIIALKLFIIRRS
jgi:hypothetical protein